MGWKSRRHKTGPINETAALETITGAPSDQAPGAARADAGPPWTGRALLLPAVPAATTASGLAARAADAARTMFDIELDFTPGSLDQVDTILNGFREPGSDRMAEFIFIFGCYLGEVMVRNADYVWVDTPADLVRHLGALTVHNPGTGANANPINKAFKRVDYGEPDNLTYFYRVFTAEDPHLD
ncbi:MAG: hypothetical protein QOG19_221 [Mycobacterium sp.]|nr:hypothetical protein [Mycobacterium sp.]